MFSLYHVGVKWTRKGGIYCSMLFVAIIYYILQICVVNVKLNRVKILANCRRLSILYQFRDPIHGFIEVSELELKIIDSQPFQRLRNIKQLATTYLVYHGAEHTRFGHSLGVMHLVSRAFNSALENYSKNHDTQLFSREKTAWYLQILRIIGLIHDLGHAPFSHGSEALFDNGLEHEDYTKKIIFETEISEHITNIGKEFCEKHNVGEEYSITPQLIWLIYGEKNAELNVDYVMPDYKFLKSFMDSELDCDKMDYLLRDSYYCGVNYGKYDINRLLSSLTVYENKKENILQLAVEHGGVHAFEEFVIARYFMFIQVYFHKTRRYLDKMLVESISEILGNKKYPDDVLEYLKLDDDIIYDKIKEKSNELTCAKNFINRNVKSCVYQSPAHIMGESDVRVFGLIKKELSKKLNCDILVDEASKLAHKIPILEDYDSGSGKGIPIMVNYSDLPTSIANESILLQSLIKPINIRRIYVDKAYSKEAQNIVKDFLDEGDE